MEDCVALLTYQAYEKEPVPCDADALNVTELPTSVGFCELFMLTVGSALTVSVSVDDVAVFPMPSVRITYTESDPDEPKEVVYVEEVAPDTAFEFRYHW